MGIFMEVKTISFLAMFLIALASVGFATTIQILEPAGEEYAYGTIPVSIQVLNDSGVPINAEIHASVMGKGITLEQEEMKYVGSFNALSEGYYTLDVWVIVDGLNYTASKTIYVNSTEVKIQVLAPTGTYGPGQIPIKLNVLVGGKVDENVNVSAKITKGNETVWEKEMTYPYNDLVNLDDGSYTFTANVVVDHGSGSAETSFTVSRSKFYMDIIDPKNGTYEGQIPVNIDLWSDGVFVHHVEITGYVYSNGTLVKTFPVPEAQYHYSTTVSLDPGIYEIVFKAAYENNTISSRVSITVPGIKTENGTTVVIPGIKPMKVEEIWTNLQRRYYSTGKTGIIAVDLKDPNTDEYITNAQISCCIYYDNETKCLPMAFNSKPIPHYQTEFTFPVEAWYEIVLNITAPGYQRTIYRFPPIKVGRIPIKPPAGSETIQNYFFTIVSPSDEETYPAGKPIELRVQILDREGMPIKDANVIAEVENETVEMMYDINGEYVGQISAGKPGTHEVTFTVKTNDTSFMRSRVFMVSNNSLTVNIVNPKNDTNVTSKVLTIQAEVLDSSGDMVPDAEVSLTAVSPMSGEHKVSMERNLSTGYYQVEYSLDSPGIWKFMVYAEKEGVLPGSNEVIVNATFQTKQTFSPRDVVAALILVAAIVIISIIVRAII